jgi:hypothetical protein
MVNQAPGFASKATKACLYIRFVTLGEVACMSDESACMGLEMLKLESPVCSSCATPIGRLGWLLKQSLACQ